MGKRLARYKVPKNVFFIKELPLTSAGKIDRRALEEKAEEFRKDCVAKGRATGRAGPTLADLAIRAAALALRKVPQLNACFRRETIDRYENITMDLMVGRHDSLVVSVVRMLTKAVCLIWRERSVGKD